MNEKLSILSELIQLAKTNKEIHDNELGFIKAIATGFGIDEARLGELFDHPVPFDPPAKDGDRIIQFHRLVLLMNVDRDASADELKAIKLAGILLGLNPLAIQEVLEGMYNYPNHVIPPNELIQIFMKYHN
jgi:hypothetical protein